MTNKQTIYKISLFVCTCILAGFCFYSCITPKKKQETVSPKTEAERIIYFIRHAKSDHNNSALTDFDRPLDSSGVKDAVLMNTFLKSKNPQADYVLMSPSVRTTQTFEGICKNLVAGTVPIKQDSSIYRCNDDDMLKALAGIADTYHCIFVIGHNPTMTNMANRFQSQQQINEVSTGGIVAIRFKLNSWKDITKAKGDLLFYERPGSLRRGR